MSHHPTQQTDPVVNALTQDQIDDLEAKFSDWQTTINLCCVATAILFLFATHFLLKFATQTLATSDGIPGLHILSQPAIWWFFPSIGALSLSFEIVLQAWSIFIARKTVNLYSDWAARQPKKTKNGITYYDSRKWCRWLALLIALPIGALTALALREHITFAEDGMHQYGFAFVAPKIYPYSQIRQVSQVDGVLGKHNKFIPRPYVVIYFADGYRWSQEDWDDTTQGITDELDATLTAHTELSFFHFHNL